MDSKIIEELKAFRVSLIRYTTLRKKMIIQHEELSDKEYEKLSELFESISIEAGRHEALIKEITGLETVHTGAGPQDIWNWALSSEANTIVTSALDNCITATARTIGVLLKDIENGKRDTKTGDKMQPTAINPDTSQNKLKAFISHGKGGGALSKLEKFVRELGIDPIIAKDQASSGRSVDDKVQECLDEADFVVIFATGDDEISFKEDGKTKTVKQPRQNVIHEIGLAEKTHPRKIIYLLEERAKFPSNISPKVYERFARQSMDDAFTAIVRELRNWGFLKVGK